MPKVWSQATGWFRDDDPSEYVGVPGYTIVPDDAQGGTQTGIGYDPRIGQQQWALDYARAVAEGRASAATSQYGAETGRFGAQTQRAGTAGELYSPLFGLPENVAKTANLMRGQPNASPQHFWGALQGLAPLGQSPDFGGMKTIDAAGTVAGLFGGLGGTSAGAQGGDGGGGGGSSGGGGDKSAIKWKRDYHRLVGEQTGGRRGSEARQDANRAAGINEQYAAHEIKRGRNPYKQGQGFAGGGSITVDHPAEIVFASGRRIPIGEYGRPERIDVTPLSDTPLPPRYYAGLDDRMRQMGMASGGSASTPAAPFDAMALADRYSAQWGLDDPLVLRSLIMAESNGNPRAIGDNGQSYGLLQAYTGPGGGRGTGHDPERLMDPDYNLQIAQAEVTQAYAAGKAQGLAGRDLARYVAIHAQRPREDTYERYPNWYDSLASGQAVAPSAGDASLQAAPPAAPPASGVGPVPPPPAPNVFGQGWGKGAGAYGGPPIPDTRYTLPQLGGAGGSAHGGWTGRMPPGYGVAPLDPLQTVPIGPVMPPSLQRGRIPELGLAAGGSVVYGTPQQPAVLYPDTTPTFATSTPDAIGQVTAPATGGGTTRIPYYEAQGFADPTLADPRVVKKLTPLELSLLDATSKAQKGFGLNMWASLFQNALPDMQQASTRAAWTRAS